MSNPAHGASLHGPALLVGLLLVGYLVAGQPAFGRWSHLRFAARVHRDRDARLHRYRRTALLEWLLAAVALLFVAAAPGLTAGQVGVRLPGGHGPAGVATAVALLGLVATLLVFRSVAGRVRPDQLAVSAEQPATRAMVELLPRTARERRAFAVLAVTAGSCEELLYRGLFLAVCTALAPGLGPAGAVLASAVAFGVAHLYQGPVGMLATGVLGGCFTVLYLLTGSLLLPVCYHALLDLRVLLLPVPGPDGGAHRARHRA